MLGHIHMDRLNADLLAFLEGKEVAEPREAARAKQVK
jgi:hypothetical protein